MRWIRILLISLVAIVVVIGGAVAFLLTLDPNDYKENIAALVDRWTGRTLVLDGRVDLDLGMQTTLELTDARLSNPDWATEPYMAQISRAKVVLDARSLLDGPIVVELIELEDASLHLESLEDGRDNWTFGAADETDTVADTVDNVDSESTGMIPLVLRHARAQGFLFTLTIPALPQPLEIRVDQLMQEQAGDGLLDATVVGTLNDRDISISGKYGPLDSLLTATDLQFDIQGDFDTLAIRGSGLIDDLTWPRRPTIDLSVAGPAIDDVTEMLGAPDLGDGGLDLKASVKPDVDGIAATVTGSIGEYVTETSATANELLAFDLFSLTTKINGPDLGNTMQIFGIENVPGGPFDLSGSVMRDGDRLEFDSTRLSIGSTIVNLNGSVNDFRNLDDANLKLQMNGNDVEQFRALFGIPGAATGPFQINADLNVRADGAELLEVFMQTNIASLKITGAIVGVAPDFSGTQLQFDGAGKNLADFTDVYDIPNVIAEPFTIKGAIELGDQKLSTTDAVTVDVGDNVLSAEGTIGYAPLERDTDIRAHATGPDLAQIAAMAGVTEFVPGVVYDISTGLTVHPEGYQLSDLVAKLDSSTLKLDGFVSKAPKFTGTRATFAASGPELGHLIADTETMQFAGGAFDVSGGVELLADSIRLQQIEVKVAGAAATLDAEIGLPLESASGSFAVAASGPNLRAVVPSQPRWNPPEAAFDVRASGKLADGLWSFDELSAQLADARLTGSGVFDQPPDLSRTNLTISTQIPDLAALGTIDEKSLPSTSVSIDMGFAGSPELFSIEPFTALIGASDIDGSVHAQLDGEVPDISLRLHSDLLDLESLRRVEEDLTGEQATEAMVELPDEIDGEPADGRLIPNTPLPLEALEKLNARVDIDVTTLLFNGIKYADVAIDGEIRDGRLIVEGARATTPHGSISSTLSLIPTADSVEVNATLDATGVYLGLGDERSDEDIANAPKIDANIDFAGTGLTYRELAAALDGKVVVSTAGGRLPNSGTRFIFGNFFQELIDAVNPFMKDDPYTKVSCAVLLLDVNDGLIAVDPGFVAQTSKMNIAATGEMSLVTEKINIGFKTQPRSRVSISAGEFINPYLKVAGTMGAPQLQLDPTGTLVTGGAAVATVGISLLATAVWDRVFREADPCGAAIEEATKGDEKKRKKFLGIF